MVNCRNKNNKHTLDIYIKALRQDNNCDINDSNKRQYMIIIFVTQSQPFYARTSAVNIANRSAILIIILGVYKT